MGCHFGPYLQVRLNSEIEALLSLQIKCPKPFSQHVHPWYDLQGGFMCQTQSPSEFYFWGHKGPLKDWKHVQNRQGVPERPSVVCSLHWLLKESALSWVAEFCLCCVTPSWLQIECSLSPWPVTHDLYGFAWKANLVLSSELKTEVVLVVCDGSAERP